MDYLRQATAASSKMMSGHTGVPVTHKVYNPDQHDHTTPSNHSLFYVLISPNFIQGAVISGYLQRKKQNRSKMQPAYVKRWYSLQVPTAPPLYIILSLSSASLLPEKDI